MLKGQNAIPENIVAIHPDVWIYLLASSGWLRYIRSSQDGGIDNIMDLLLELCLFNKRMGFLNIYRIL